MTNRTRLVRSAPYFPVKDVERAATHYEAVLGFRREYSAGTPAQFAIVSRDGLAIMLRLVPEPSRICPNEQQGGTWDAFFWVNDAESLCHELCSKGADIVYGPIIQREYAMKEFAVRDGDGYVLGFGQPWNEQDYELDPRMAKAPREPEKRFGGTDPCAGKQPVIGC